MSESCHAAAREIYHVGKELKTQQRRDIKQCRYIYLRFGSLLHQKPGIYGSILLLLLPGERDACSLSSAPPRDPRSWDITISVQGPGSDPPRVSGHLTHAEYSATDQLVGGWHGGDTWVDTVETRVLGYGGDTCVRIQ